MLGHTSFKGEDFPRVIMVIVLCKTKGIHSVEGRFRSVSVRARNDFDPSHSTTVRHNPVVSIKIEALFSSILLEGRY